MGCYRHLTRDDRDEIAVLRAAGHTMRAIAMAMGKAPSTISRELKRNALDSGRYAAHVADGAYMARRQRSALLERDKRLAGFVRDRLTEGWSPQQISGWLQSGAETGLRTVAMETIYAFLYRNRAEGRAALALPRPPSQAPAQARQRDPHVTRSRGGVSIHERPECVNDRSETRPLGGRSGDLPAHPPGAGAARAQDPADARRTPGRQGGAPRRHR